MGLCLRLLSSFERMVLVRKSAHIHVHCKKRSATRPFTMDSAPSGSSSV